MNRRLRTLVALIIVSAILSGATVMQAQQPQSKKPVLIKIITKDKKSVVGELMSQDRNQIKLLELKTGKTRVFQKYNLRDIRKDITEKEAIYTAGLPNLIAWKMKRLIPAGSDTGKIASIDLFVIYVTLGSQSGIEKGQELAVFRGDKEIKDPDTGKVLGKRQRRIARLQVVEVQDKFCKAKLLGELEVNLKLETLCDLLSRKKLSPFYL